MLTCMNDVEVRGGLPLSVATIVSCTSFAGKNVGLLTEITPDDESMENAWLKKKTKI